MSAEKEKEKAINADNITIPPVRGEPKGFWIWDEFYDFRDNPNIKRLLGWDNDTGHATGSGKDGGILPGSEETRETGGDSMEKVQGHAEQEDTGTAQESIR